MRITKMRSIASVLAGSFLASAVGAAEAAPNPSLWNAAQDAGKKSPVLAQTATGGTTDSRSDRTFFKTPAGKITLGLMVVGAGLTIYSTSHDRKPVKSPIR